MSVFNFSHRPKSFLQPNRGVHIFLLILETIEKRRFFASFLMRTPDYPETKPFPLITPLEKHRKYFSFRSDVQTKGWYFFLRKNFNKEAYADEQTQRRWYFVIG